MNNAIAHRGYLGRVDFDADDNIFVARVVGVTDSIATHGETVAELQTRFREAVDSYLDACAKVGRAPQKPYSGQLMLRTGADVHAKVAIAAELAGKSLNQWATEALAAAARREETAPGSPSALQA